MLFFIKNKNLTIDTDKKKGYGEKMSAYNVYLQGDHWKNFREKTIKERKKCEHCGTEKNLIVHHKSYLNLGSEKPEDVLVLCDDCHREVHEKAHSGKARFNTYGFSNYFKNIERLVDELSESEVYFLVKLSNCIDWDEGQLLYKRDRRPVKYADLEKIMSYSSNKLNKVIKSLKEKQILYNGKAGYYISEKMYKGKNKFKTKDKQPDEIENLKKKYPHVVGD